MKSILVIVGLLFSSGGFAMVETYKIPATKVTTNELSENGVELDTVCFRASSFVAARRSCQIGLETITLLSNDQIRFEGSCETIHTCKYGFQYALEAKAFVLP